MHTLSLTTHHAALGSCVPQLLPPDASPSGTRGCVCSPHSPSTWSHAELGVSGSTASQALNGPRGILALNRKSVSSLGFKQGVTLLTGVTLKCLSLNIKDNVTRWHHASLDVMHGEGHSTAYVGIQPKWLTWVQARGSKRINPSCICKQDILANTWPGLFKDVDGLKHRYRHTHIHAYIYTHTHRHTPLTHKHTYTLLLFSHPVVSDSLRPHGLQHINNIYN